MELVRRDYTGRGHAGHYATIERLVKRGFVTRVEQAGRVALSLTARGRDAIALGRG
jgi:hypothetical protein